MSNSTFLFRFCGRQLTHFGLLLLAFLLSLSHSNAQGCNTLTPSFINYEPCKFRLSLANTSECVPPSMSMIVESGSITNLSANGAQGWSVQQTGPGFYAISYNGPFIPIGTSFPLIFTAPPGSNPSISLTWEFTCGLGEGCAFGPISLETCPDPMDASVIGVKYRECNGAPYSNQPVLSGWTIQLFNEAGELFREDVTDNNGEYRMFDLPKGNYYVKEIAAPGWTPNVPASGEYSVNLDASQQAVRNFGNCPSCSCDSITILVTQASGTANTGTYCLNVLNSGAYCFPYIDLQVGAGQLTGWNLSTGWTAQPINNQVVHFIPSGGFIPLGASNPGCFTITGAGAQSFTVNTITGTPPNQMICGGGYEFFVPPPPPVLPECCPTGMVAGPDVVINGDFNIDDPSNSQFGFTSDYNYVFPTGGNMSSGNNSVLTESQAYLVNNAWICPGITGPGDKYLAVDGIFAAGLAAWREQVTVTPGVKYNFCAMARNMIRPDRFFDDPIVELWVKDGASAPVKVATMTLPEFPSMWHHLKGSWTAVSNNLTLEIRSGSINTSGNDFAIDKVTFESCSEPCEVSINVTPVQGHCDQVTVTATTIAGNPVSYQWCDGSTGASYSTQVFCNVPTTYCVTATCPGGATATAVAVYTATDNIPPSCVTVPGFGVTLNNNCAYSLTAAQVDGGSTDNCAIQSMSVSPSVLNGCGNHVVTLTVTDWCGNTSTCSTGIQTIETTPPTITNCPPPLTIGGFINNFGVCEGSLTLPQTFPIDNCPGPITVTNDAPAGLVFYSGTTNVTFTATDACNNTSTCVWPVTVICLPDDCPSCPGGVAIGNNLVLNGNFENGNVQFTNNYTFSAPNTSLSPGEYSVITGLQVNAANPGWSGNDHTTGAGQMLVVDGAGSGGQVIWRTANPISIQNNTDYAFCAYVNNLVNVSNNLVDPQLQIWINNTQWLGNQTFTIPENPNQWIPIGGVWNSGANTIANIEIRMVSTGPFGNDIAVDDITFAKCNSCTCGTYSNMFYRFAQGAPSYAAACGDTLISSCSSSFPFMLDGDFMCQGSSCPTNTPFFWTLANPAGQPILSSPPNQFAVPGFSISIPQNNFTNQGLYTLTLGAVCGLDTCWCTFYINSFGCPCPSPDLQQFCQNVMNAVSFTVNNIVCDLTISVNNLPAGDEISWINWGDGGQSGPLSGTGSLTHHYSSPGTYTITYLAIEINPATGLICYEKVISQTVTLDCCAPIPPGLVGWWPMDELDGDPVAQDIIGVSPATPLDGGGGTVVAGVIGNGMGPFPVTGVVGGALQCVGTPNYFYMEVPDHPSLNFPPNSAFTVDAWINTTGGTQSEPILSKISANKGYFVNVQGSNGVLNLTLILGYGNNSQVYTGPPIAIGQWNFIAVSADLANNTATFYVGNNGAIVDQTIAIAPGADASNNQPLTIGYNSQNTHFNMTIDELEIFNTVVSKHDLEQIFYADSLGKCDPSTIPTRMPIASYDVQIYPNPNAGAFIVELPEPARADMRMRVVDVTGRIVMEQQAMPGSARQEVIAPNLPAGLYFLQLAEQGKALGTSRFVKN